jgi:hypothetical protein
MKDEGNMEDYFILMELLRFFTDFLVYSNDSTTDDLKYLKPEDEETLTKYQNLLNKKYLNFL